MRNGDHIKHIPHKFKFNVPNRTDSIQSEFNSSNNNNLPPSFLIYAIFSFTSSISDLS